MRGFKYPRFSRFAAKEGISDAELWKIVKELEDGKVDVDLGGGVFKQRLARSGEGKSGGYRLIVYFKNEARAFFVYGFTKTDRDNIDEGELRAFKVDARDQFTLTDEQINIRLKNGTLIEIFMEDQGEI